MVLQQMHLCNEINQGIRIHMLETKKFKTTVISILVRSKLTREYATQNALLAEVLKKGCSKYTSSLAINRKMEELYGAVFDSYIIKKGEEQIICFYMECLSEFSDNNDIVMESVAFLSQIITNPLTDGDSFLDGIVEREKVTLRQKIEGRMDDKKEYAKIRCIEEMCKEEPFGIYADGYVEDLELIDGNSLYLHYKNLLKSAPIEIVISGELKSQDSIETIKKAFSYKREKKINKFLPSSSTLKEGDVNEIQEKMDILQGKLCMGFRSKSESTGKSFFSTLVFNEILGGGASSRLFLNIREKESLCYYINTFIYRFKMILFLQAGIDKKNYEKTVKLIEETIESIKKQGVKEEELKNAKMSLIKMYRNNDDYQPAAMDFYITQYLLQSDETTDDFVKNIEKVSLEDVLNAAKSICLDTIYFLSDDALSQGGQ